MNKRYVTYYFKIRCGTIVVGTFLNITNSEYSAFTNMFVFFPPVQH